MAGGAAGVGLQLLIGGRIRNEFNLQLVLSAWRGLAWGSVLIDRNQ